MKKIVTSILVSLFILLAAFKYQPAGGFIVPDGWPRPAYNFRKHPLSAAKVQLGRMLFYDPVLSRDSTISCGSCHSPFNAFTHTDHSLSHGIDGRIGNRNSQALINLAWSQSFMWDGAVTHLEQQAVKPISNPMEMDETMPHIVAKLGQGSTYPALFEQAYGGTTITEQHLLDAVTQFMLTLVSANSRYDRVMKGSETFTPMEASGYTIFKQHCAACHKEPLFTNNTFENNGLTPDDSLKDIGRMAITGHRTDSLKFKVPTLRNVEYTAPYMHDGRFKSLGMVVNNYMRGLQHGPTLSPKLQKGIFLTGTQKTELLAFLYTLSDKEFLTNPDFSFPRK